MTHLWIIGEILSQIKEPKNLYDTVKELRQGIHI